MKLVNSAQMRALEQRADASGNSFSMMMERAGRAVADALTERLITQGTRHNRVLVLVGPGNNGGDGLVCARVLFDAGAPVSLYVWKRARSESDENWRLCDERRIPTSQAERDPNFILLRELLAHTDVIVDALLGTGVSKPIEGSLRDVLAVVKEHLAKPTDNDLLSLVPTLADRQRRVFIVAVDLPSGLNPDTGALDPAALTADLTVTFGLPKIGQLTPPGAFATGELVVADIGIRAEWLEQISLEAAAAHEVAALLPVRSRDSNKGTFGKGMICAGSVDYVGAAYLAGMSAARAGAGLVTLALARAIHPIVAAGANETTFIPLPDEEGALIPDAVPVLLRGLAGYDALLVGPGLGRRSQTIEFVRRLLRISPTQTLVAGESTGPALPPLVIDADALYALSQTPNWWGSLIARGGPAAILTPHPGEMAGLCGLKISEVQADRVGVARQFATEWRQIVVLKGAYTVVAGPDGRATIIPFATPALATAGTGDVLAGTICALLAQRLEAFDAAVAGAYLHGLAGKKAEEEIGAAGVVAGDLLPRLPAARRSLI